MTDRIGICTNFGNCPAADQRREISVPEGEDFVCPEPDCGQELMPGKTRNGSKKPVLIGASAFVVALGIGAWLFLSEPTLPPVPAPVPAPEPAPIPAEAAPAVPDLTGDELISMLEEGEFEKALAALPGLPKEEPQYDRISTALEAVVLPSVQFQVQKDGQEPGDRVGLDSPDLSDLTMTSADNYRIRFEIPEQGPPVYLYVFQLDHYGKLHRVFPDPVYGGTMGNPVVPGQVRFMPPGENDWLYLDELSSAETGPIPETIFVIASPWKAEDLNRLFGRIHEATDAEAQEVLTKEFTERIRRRQQTNLDAVYFESFRFNHAKP